MGVQPRTHPLFRGSPQEGAGVTHFLDFLTRFLPDLHLVGGAVRDALLGRPSNDLDVATSARPEAVMALAADQGLKAIPSGVAFGTVTLLVEGEPVEVTTFRRDISCDGRHAQVAFADTVEEDLARRDFTINAMTQRGDGELVDPFGGRADLEAGVIRAVGDPYARFREDYLRVIRAARFAGRYGFEIEAGTLTAARELAPEVLGRVAPERVSAEVAKALDDPAPSRFFRHLESIGLLYRVLPELAGAGEMLQDPVHHPEGDVLTHILQVVDRAPVAMRLHALLHDIGKPATAEWDAAGYYRFPRHAEVGAELVRSLARRFNFSRELEEELATTTRLHMRPLQEPTGRAVRRFQAEAGQHLAKLRLLCEADAGDRREHLAAYFAPQPVPVAPILMGRDLIALGVAPGPAMGTLLRRAYEVQLEEGVADKAALLEAIGVVGGAPA